MGHVAEKTLHAVDTEIMRLIELGDMTKEALECLDKLVDIKKDLAEIEKMEMNSMSQNGENSYNYGGRNGEDRMMHYPYPYQDNSYMPRRDTMGRFSRNSERDQIISHIEKELNTAQTDGERELIQRILSAV